MATNTPVRRLAAFTDRPEGGNPAGVWLGDRWPSPETMQRIAAEVGYSETAFVEPATGRSRRIRYFSPLAEVPFCGHASIATGVVLGELEGPGRFELETPVGPVPLQVRPRADGLLEAVLVSVPPRHRTDLGELLGRALDVLGWAAEELDPALPPALAYAGAWHLVLAAATRSRLDRLNYDFDRLKSLMLAHDLTTLQLVWRESERRFHARNPFPVGGIVEDPATGAAAAALGGYLRDAGLMAAPARFEIRQGERMGRPSLLSVAVPASGGIEVAGTAVAIPEPVA